MRDIAIDAGGDIVVTERGDAGVVSGAEAVMQAFKWEICKIDFLTILGEPLNQSRLRAIEYVIKQAAIGLPAIVKVRAIPLSKDTAAVVVTVEAGGGYGSTTAIEVKPSGVRFVK